MTPQDASETTFALAPAEEATVARLARETGLSATVARVLAVRGLDTAEAVRVFLEPSLERDWLAPESIPGMAEVAAAVAEAVRENKRIVVFGDFDLDGISAAAVATRGLRALGGTVDAFVPHRFDEGYGLTPAAIERLLEMRPEFVVTVDCGISAGSEVAALVARGIGVAVTDHHEPGENVPEGVPVADPKLSGPGCSELAGAGVALKLVQAVGALLGAEAVWRNLTDLACLGTIADVVP